MLARLIPIQIALFFLFAAPAIAQQRPEGPPVATIAIQQLHVAFIGSAALGGGTLTYHDHSYPITVGGLGVGGFGASHLSATGAVYGLERKEDLAGVYAQVRAGWALGDQGGGTVWLRNNKGVAMRLKTHRRGLHLAVGVDGVIIGFK